MTRGVFDLVPSIGKSSSENVSVILLIALTAMQ
jgi:hypothetical protein